MGSTAESWVDEEADGEEEEDAVAICALCGEPILFADEMFLLELCDATPGGDGEAPFITYLAEPNGDYVFEPYWAHFECGEEIWEDLREAAEDRPPAEPAVSLLKCSICDSGIAPLEPFCLSTFGEIRPSGRSPDFVQAAYVYRMSRQPSATCLACIAAAIPEYFDWWEDVIDGLGDRNVGED